MLIQIFLRYINARGKISKQIPIDSTANVEELQDIIQRTFGVSQDQQIIKYIFLNFEVRVIPGFNLDFYEIGNNSIIEIQKLNVEQDQIKKIEEIADQEVVQKKQLRGDIYEQRMELINKLLNPIQTPLNVIREEEEKDENEVTQEEKKVLMTKKLFFEVTRNNKTSDQKEFMSLFKSLDKEYQFLVLGNLDNVGWSGIHYAVLFNNKELLQDLMNIFEGEMLDYISTDGFSPLFLALQQKNWDIFRLFSVYAKKDQIEIQTTKGSLSHQIFKEAPFEIIKSLILKQQINCYFKDFNGVQAIDVC